MSHQFFLAQGVQIFISSIKTRICRFFNPLEDWGVVQDYESFLQSKVACNNCKHNLLLLIVNESIHFSKFMFTGEKNWGLVTRTTTTTIVKSDGLCGPGIYLNIFVANLLMSTFFCSLRQSNIWKRIFLFAIDFFSHSLSFKNLLFPKCCKVEIELSRPKDRKMYKRIQEKKVFLAYSSQMKPFHGSFYIHFSSLSSSFLKQR